MRKQILLLIIFLSLSCGEKRKEKVSEEKEIEKVVNSNKQIDTSTITKKENSNNLNVVERYFPKEKKLSKFDTIISTRNLKISIESRFLNSNVINEFESGDKKYIDKYRDSEKHIMIVKANEVLIDTVFKKEDFVSYAGQELLEVANFYRYDFNEVGEGTIEFFGSINKPETDWSFIFYHSFDLKTNKFSIEEVMY